MVIIDLSYDDMKKVASLNDCSCGGGLSIAWIGGRDVLRCANSLEHNTYKPKEKYPEYLRKEIYKTMTTELAKISKPQMLKRINSVKWPRDLTGPMLDMLAQVAIEYGLDPLEGELMIYQGKPYVGINGRLRKAQETHELGGIATRPGTKEEKAARQLQEDDYLSFVQVWRKGAEHPFEGWGTVHRWEIDKMIAACKENGSDSMSLPIVKNPQDTADKRGKAVALKEGFHLPLPSMEDIPGGPPPKYDVESTGRDLDETNPKPGFCPVHNVAMVQGVYGPYCPRKVNGKWCKGKAPDSVGDKTEVKAEVQKEAPGPKVSSRAMWDTYTRKDIPDFQTLEKIVLGLCGMKAAEIYHELGVSSRSDMTISPWDSFLTLKEMKFPSDEPPSGDEPPLEEYPPPPEY